MLVAPGCVRLNVMKARDFFAGLAALKSFIARHGHSRVPPRHIESGFPLGQWVRKQRAAHRQVVILQGRLSLLAAVEGWQWTEPERFDRGCTALRAFLAREDHLNVPPGHVESDFPLYAWIREQRARWRSGRMRSIEVAQLESLPGWSWGIPTPRRPRRAFEDAVSQLQRFFEREGHVDVPPRHFEGGFGLYQWLAVQRSLYRRGKLAPSRVARLQAFPGWQWKSRPNGFEIGLHHLEEFIERERHSRVKRRFRADDGYLLGNWVTMQRSLYRKGKLSSDRIAALESLPGWEWSVSKRGARQAGGQTRATRPSSASTPIP